MEDLLALINELKNSNKLIIVEGKRDIISLKKLGLANIVELKKPIFQQCEEISKTNKEVVILMDLDKEGKKLYHKLKQNFDRLGVKVDNKLREYLFTTKLCHIEGLDSFLENNN